MKKWLTLSLALVAAAVTQAVTVAWTVPNSDYNVNDWAGTDSSGKLKFNVYFVYSASALDADGAYGKVTAALAANSTTPVGDGTVAYGYSTGVDNVTTANGNGTLQAFYGSGLNPQPVGSLVNGTGFYYMVVVSTDSETAGQFAVAGTESIVTITNNAVTGTDSAGIYANPTGTKPSGAEYYLSPGEWMGGSFENALVPEPTVLALLALGVAGVALRRKKNFMK